MAKVGRVKAQTIDLTPLAPLIEDPSSAALFVDFDGTVSPIVDDPATAEPLAGVAEVLAALVDVLGRVGVVSGRPVSFIEPFFDPRIVLAGLYGLEVAVAGHRSDHPLGGSWREVVDDVVAISEARGPAGMRVESKGLSLTLHFRGAPERERAVTRWAEQQAARSGLEARPAKMSVELHPPIDSDKGTAITALSEDLATVCYVGDDHGDLDAFDALDTMANAGRAAVRVAVRSDEADAELVERADIVVNGPAGSLALLRGLLTRLS